MRVIPLDPVGAIFAAQLKLLSWEELMVRFTVVFRPFVELYDRLERNAHDEDAEALAFLARHERLLLGFAEAELAGDATKPLLKIRSLIASADQKTFDPGARYIIYRGDPDSEAR